MCLSVCSDCLSACYSAVRSCWTEPYLYTIESSHPDKEIQAKGGRNVQRLQTQSRRRVREEDWEYLFGVHQELRGVVPVLEIILYT